MRAPRATALLTPNTDWLSWCCDHESWKHDRSVFISALGLSTRLRVTHPSTPCNHTIFVRVAIDLGVRRRDTRAADKMRADKEYCSLDKDEVKGRLPRGYFSYMCLRSLTSICYTHMHKEPLLVTSLHLCAVVRVYAFPLFVTQAKPFPSF